MMMMMHETLQATAGGGVMAMGRPSNAFPGGAHFPFGNTQGTHNEQDCERNRLWRWHYCVRLRIAKVHCTE